MLSYEDCLALSELTEEEIEAIAEHEHLPELAALEFGNYLMHDEKGRIRIKCMIEEDLLAAQAKGDRAHAAKLKLALRQFCDSHHL
jgi:hypothetical protein